VRCVNTALKAALTRRTPKQNLEEEMAISTEDFVKQIETMSVLDLSNLVKALEDRFGVPSASQRCVNIYAFRSNIQELNRFRQQDRPV